MVRKVLGFWGLYWVSRFKTHGLNILDRGLKFYVFRFMGLGLMFLGLREKHEKKTMHQEKLDASKTKLLIPTCEHKHLY